MRTSENYAFESEGNSGNLTSGDHFSLFLFFLDEVEVDFVRRLGNPVHHQNPGLGEYV